MLLQRTGSRAPGLGCRVGPAVYQSCARGSELHLRYRIRVAPALTSQPAAAIQPRPATCAPRHPKASSTSMCRAAATVPPAPRREGLGASTVLAGMPPLPPPAASSMATAPRIRDALRRVSSGCVAEGGEGGPPPCARTAALREGFKDRRPAAHPGPLSRRCRRRWRRLLLLLLLLRRRRGGDRGSRHALRGHRRVDGYGRPAVPALAVITKGCWAGKKSKAMWATGWHYCLVIPRVSV